MTPDPMAPGATAPATNVPVGRWQAATVVAIRDETPSAKTFRLRLPTVQPRLAGQHFILRLTAPDGYRAQRSYSVANAADENDIELTVERLPGGEVSEFLHDVLAVGDLLDVRGPVGYFGWDARTPAVGLCGGSGAVPVVSMLRTAQAIDRPDAVALVVSVREPGQLYYADELTRDDRVRLVFTRTAPADSPRPAGRLQVDDVAGLIREDGIVFVSGSPAFCEHATSVASQAGARAEQIRVERFGPSG